MVHGISVVDPYHFHLDQDPDPDRGKQIRIRLWIRPHQNRKKLQLFFLILFNQKYDTQNYDFLLLLAH